MYNFLNYRCLPSTSEVYLFIFVNIFADLMEVEEKEEVGRREGEEERDTCTPLDRLMCGIVDELEFDMSLS